MEHSKRLKDDLKSQIRSRVRREKRTAKELQKFCEDYRCWVETQKATGTKPITIIAEGDSWFKYMIGFAIIWHLENLLDIQILNLAWPGDEVEEMTTPKKLKRLANQLKSGAASRTKFDFFLFSGGGNDLVGKDTFHKWLNPYESGMQAQDILNMQTLNPALDLVESGYREIIALRDKHSPKTQLMFHGYDYAIPSDKGVCGRGPWMNPGLKLRKVPVRLRAPVVRLFLEEFDRRLDRLAEENDRITVAQTQGVLEENHWSNELHPTKSGFKKQAKVFEAEILRLTN
ncbi:SGNH/GDSL hydrolase family protein [bacterium SCSIO 12696]|nr:SGNH/GDSL hydrolase family protein [bacterium SCSIO 12696]